MIQLLKIWSFSHFRLLKANTVLTLLGISFGVAIFTAIQVANQNIRDSFQSTIQQVAGKGGLEIKGEESGFPEEAILKVRSVPGVKEAMPMVLQSVSTERGGLTEEIMVLGVDLLQDVKFHRYTLTQPGLSTTPDLNLLLEPTSIMISPFLAERFHLKAGSVFTLKIGAEQIQTHVAGILRFQDDLPSPYGGYFALMDIASSQLLFHKIGRLDRINVLQEESVSEEQLAKALETELPGLQVQSPQEEKKMVDSLLGSFNLNLKALSEISILVGMFLIYNTLSLLVVRRKVEIGILRSIGLSGRELFLLILLEALLLGLIGSIIGIALGFLLSRWVLKAVSLTITSLYLKVYTDQVSLSLSIGFTSLIIGLGVSLLSASFPAWEASQTSPRDNLIRKGEIKPFHHAPGLLMGGFGFLFLALFLAFLPSYHHIPLFGYLSAFFFLSGLSLMIPSSLYVLQKILRASFLKNRLIFLKIAGSGFFQRPARNGIGIAALMMSVSLLISVTLMIDSFRKTVDSWFNQTIKADLVVEPKEWLNPGNQFLVSPAIADPIRAIKGVSAVDLFREDHLLYQNEPFLLNSRDLLIHRKQSQYLLTRGDSSEKLQEVIDRKEILISERFSLQHHLREGETATLNTPSGLIPFKIGGIFYDYTTQGGKVVIDRSLYLKYWKDDRVNILAIYLEKGSLSERESEKVRERVSALLQDKGLLVISNQEIKTKVMEIFDETFAITRVLEWITILISLLGVINMLLANILDQKREIGILRSIGASRNQIGALTLYEAGWMTLIANLLGGIGGLGLSLILIYVINKQSFFWTIQFDFSGIAFLKTFSIVTLTALLAAFFPARKATGENIGETVHYE